MEKINLVIVGRVCEAKGQKEAVEALKILINKKNIRNVHLNIVGYMGIDHYEITLKEDIVNNGIADYVTLHPFSNRPFDISSKCDSVPIL